MKTKPATFGQRLRTLREAAGLSMQSLAEKSGSTRQYVWALESDKKKPSWEIVQAMAAALGCSTEDFR